MVLVIKSIHGRSWCTQMVRIFISLCIFWPLQIIIIFNLRILFPSSMCRWRAPHTQPIYADILPSAARFAVSHYDEYPNWRQNQIFDNQIHHHKVNYYNFSGTCVPRNANIIQLGNFNETLVELACTTNHLQQLNEEISRLNLLFSGLRMEDRQRINYFLTEMMRIEDANAVDPR